MCFYILMGEHFGIVHVEAPKQEGSVFYRLAVSKSQKKSLANLSMTSGLI